MTADQLAQAQLSLAQLQLWVTAVAIILGPLAGVLFTLWFQARKEKRDQKNQLFLILMAHRKANPPAVESVNSLNVIDVVFADEPKVTALWHEYYDLLCQSPINLHLVEIKFLDLLSSMAKVLGFKDISQTDMSKFYTPAAHSTQIQLNQNLQVALLDFIKTLNNSVTPLNSLVQPAVKDSNGDSK